MSWRDAAQLRPLTAQEGGEEAARWMEVADGTKYYFKPAMTLDDEVSWVRRPFRLTHALLPWLRLALAPAPAPALEG